eukprot:m.50570 g.50570  ORF g.50570 m.50570 type:complete len:314 (+) comp13434_c0_seq1:248-1189(+)
MGRSRRSSEQLDWLDGEAELSVEALEKIRRSGKSLYQVLHIAVTANDAEIKKAYRKRALRCHPDKTNDPAKHAEFATVATAYSVLSNPQQRHVYDELDYSGLYVAAGIHRDRNAAEQLDECHPCAKALFYFFGVVTLGYLACGCCFCCNCCCGHCEGFAERVVGKANMDLYRQANTEAEVQDVLDGNTSRRSSTQASVSNPDGFYDNPAGSLTTPSPVPSSPLRPATASVSTLPPVLEHAQLTTSAAPLVVHPTGSVSVGDKASVTQQPTSSRQMTFDVAPTVETTPLDHVSASITITPAMAQAAPKRLESVV